MVGKSFLECIKAHCWVKKFQLPKKGRQKYLDFDIQNEWGAVNLRSASGK